MNDPNAEPNQADRISPELAEKLGWAGLELAQGELPIEPVSAEEPGIPGMVPSLPRPQSLLSSELPPVRKLK